MKLVSWFLRSSHSLCVLPTCSHPHPRNAMWWFFFQHTVSSLSLKISNSCLRLLRRLFVPSMFPSTACFRRQFLRKTWSIELAFLLFIWRSFLPWFYVTLLRFSHDRSNWSSPSFCTIAFHNFQGTSDPFSEASDFQHHIKICSKYSISSEGLTISCQTDGGEFQKSNYEIGRSNLREQDRPRRSKKSGT